MLKSLKEEISKKKDEIFQIKDDTPHSLKQKLYFQWKKKYQRYWNSKGIERRIKIMLKHQNIL